MKKEYVKPYIAVESFQLNAAIAAGCNADNKIALNHGIDDCANYDGFGDLTYFGDMCEKLGGTDVTDPGGDINDTVCYHGPILSEMFMDS